MTILAKHIAPPTCMQLGCDAPATVQLYRRYMPGELLMQRHSAGRYCQHHSIERVEYEVELECEQRESIAADLAAGRAITYGPTGMYGCKRAVCECGASYERTDTPDGNRAFARVLDKHSAHVHPGRIVRFRYES